MAVLILFLVRSIIYAVRATTWGRKQRSLLYYCTFSDNCPTSAETRSTEIIIPTTHLFRGQMMKYGRYRAKSERSALSNQVNDDTFGLPHTLKLFRKYTQITAICNLLNNIILIEGIKKTAQSR